MARIKKNLKMFEELRDEISDFLDADRNLNSADDDYTDDVYGTCGGYESFAEAMQDYEIARDCLLDGISNLKGCDRNEAKKIAYDLTGVSYIH